METEPRQAELIPVPVYSHVYKYLNKQLSGSPVEINSRSTVGIWLTQVLRRPIHENKYDESVSRMNQVYPISLSQNKLFKFGMRHFTSMTIIQYNGMLDNEIRKECYTHVKYCTQYRSMEQKDAIFEFMELYDLSEDDIRFDTLKKSMQRFNNSEHGSSSLFWLHN